MLKFLLFMKTQIKRNKGIEIVAVLAILALFFLTRLFHIQGKYLPIFVDEATYVHWAQMGAFDASQRLISLTDGLEPMFVWLTTAFMTLPLGPLIAGRLVSVFSGALTLLGLYFLARELFQNRWTGILSALLYTAFPFALILNRMAIYVSLSGAFFVWSIYLSVVLTRYLKTESAFMLALTLGGGLLTKLSGFLSIYLLPLSLILFKFDKKQNTHRLVRLAWLSLLAIILAMLYYSVLLLSPQFSFLKDKSNRFLYSWPEVFRFDMLPVVVSNLLKSFNWLIIYFSWPWVILAISSFFTKSRRREILFLWLWFLIPFVALVVLGRSIYPRYLFFLSLPLLPIIAEMLMQSLERIQKLTAAVALMVLIFAFVSFSDYKILTDFARAPIPELDLYQYVNGWPAGGGVREIVDFLEKESKKGIIYVYSDGIYGSLPTTVIDLYFRDNANIKHQGVELTAQIPDSVIVSSLSAPTYLIVNQAQKPPSWPIELIAQYQKGVGNWYIRLYRFKANF